MKKILLPLLIVLLLLVSCEGGEHVCGFGDWQELEPATCTKEGKEYRSCDCGNTESRTTAMLSHVLVKFEAKPATCTESGFAAFEYCELCSYTTFAGELPPAHDIATVPAKEPTCTECGYEAYEYCKMCENYTTYSEISATGHSFSALECEKCDASLTAVAIPSDTAALTDSITAAYYVTDTGLSLLEIQGTGNIPDFATSPFSTLKPTHLIIGDGITAIGTNTFAGMSSIVSVTIGSSVTNIGDGAFSECYRITEVINNSSLSISYDTLNGGLGMYANCIFTSQATRVKFIGDFIFYVDRENYTLISYIGTDAHVVLPVVPEVDTYVVRNYAFYDLDFLLTVECGAHVIHVGPYAFLDCDNLTI